MITETMKLLLAYTVAVMLSGEALGAGFQNTSALPPDLSTLSLEDLTLVDVCSVARKTQELFKTPAAVFVITREDIRASGANTLPELFRMVPGVQVAQVSANAWAVSARGFNSRFADKLLVLIDGRSIYSEIYSGVFWDQNDLVIDNIERIEVIRGPGGTLWGANAVNGVINIITRSAKQTLGTKIVAVGGSLENGGTIRHGAELGAKFQYRGSLKYLRLSPLRSDDGESANDGGSSLRAGARGDWQPTAKDLITVHGDFFHGSETQRVANRPMTGGASSVSDDVGVIGGYALGRWEHRFVGSDIALQIYYSDSRRQELGGAGCEHILDFDFQNHLPSFHRNDIVWGLGYRVNADHISRTPAAFSKDHHRDVLQSFFFEDEYSLVPQKLIVTGGFFESVKLTGESTTCCRNNIQTSIPKMAILFVHRFREAPLAKLFGASKHTL
jgi:iron complex outermembrane recepter protein